MKFRLLWLGIAAFLLALIWVLPVRWISGLLPPQLHCVTWSGSVWRGQCAGLTLQSGAAPLQVELLRWKLRPAALLRLSLGAGFEVRTAQGSASGHAELGSGGRMAARDVTITAQFDRRLYTSLPAGWAGQLEARHLAMRMRGKQLEALSGELELRDFHDAHGGPLGSYSLVFPPAAAAPFVGALKDTGGPLEVRASLTINPDRRWLLDGQIAARPGTADALSRRLDYLGAADANGRRRLAAEGTFN